jgi:membrane fusion protein, heavy metal efflux system
VAQNVTNAAAAGVNLSGSATAFTIADLSTVWIVCDVYENDIPKCNSARKQRSSSMPIPIAPSPAASATSAPVLDPSIRTAKVRIEVPNPGILKLGMFGTATFRAEKRFTRVVPRTPFFTCMTATGSSSPRAASSSSASKCIAGNMLPGNKQELLSPAFNPGQQVVSNVLQLEATLEAQ